jgi:hypothetical protein
MTAYPNAALSGNSRLSAACSTTATDGSLQHFAVNLHVPGVRPLHELLRELEAGDGVRPRFAVYARLDPDLVREIDADQLPAPIFLFSERQ